MKMKVFEGKTPAERNKLIAAVVLGVVALLSLYIAFGRSFFGGGTTTARTQGSPTPRPASSPGARPDQFRIPTQDEQALNDVVPVAYNPRAAGAPDPGRNIFAFYEPPPPCPECPTPYVPTPAPRTPSPTPTPVFFAAGLNVQNVYAGSRGFRLEVNGDRFTPEARVFFNQTEMPTRFVSAQLLAADIPASMIAQEGSGQVMVRTPDGRAWSEQLMLKVQAPPKPTVQYIGMIGRTRFNNDTAYFIDASRPITPTNQPPPFGARLSDVVGGRFRLIDIGPTEVVFEDVSLGFKHRVPISKAPTTASTSTPGRPPTGFPDGSIVVPGFPGMPANIQPVQPRPARSPANKDADDDDGDGGGK